VVSQAPLVTPRLRGSRGGAGSVRSAPFLTAVDPISELGELTRSPMLSLALLPSAVCLGLCVVPGWLLRRRIYARAQDYFVSSEHTPPGVIQNSSIASSLWLAVFGPFFAWGASGSFWPSIMGAACFGSGLYLMYLFRHPLLEFLHDALIHDRSVTVHQFIAQQHGNDARVRLVASSLTLGTFAVLAMGEAFALASFLRPGVGNAMSIYVAIFCMVFMVMYTVVSGNSGVMRSTQLQLGMIYFGLIGATALLLYQLVSDLRPLPSHGILAIVLAAAFCAILVCYRRSRYVDTSPISDTSREAGSTGLNRDAVGVRLLIRFEKIFNVIISILAVWVIVVATMGLSAIGWLNVARDSIDAIQRTEGVSSSVLIAMSVFLFCYPMVDLTNWQRLAAFEKDAIQSHLAPTVKAAALRKLFRIYGMESAFVILFVCTIGAISILVTGTSGVANLMKEFVDQLAAPTNPTISLLLISLFAIVLSTMTSLFSASLCSIRYDILPLLPQAILVNSPPAGETRTSRRAIALGLGIYVIIFLVFLVADQVAHIRLTSGFVALFFTFASTQLSYVPLVWGAIIGKGSRGLAPVPAGWALIIIFSSFAIAIFAVTIYLITQDETCLWTAVPANLALALLLFVVAQLQNGEGRTVQ
jgi:hypothetical protein